ncbi:MAG: response regulator transcription factor [Nitrosomonadales bacterium]|nr:response regulator transcription factor [Nitrosomonadales bacterium]
MTTTNILLIDDHAMFRSGLRMVLNARMEGAEIFEAGSLVEATQDAPETIDVILLDINLPGLNGLDGIAFLKRKWPQVPVVVLSSQDGPETVRDALARGAVRFISKADTADRIVALLNRVLRGEYNAPENQPGDGDEVLPIPLHLTPRQCEVLDLLCQGMSNKLIARRLALSENTVRGHVQAILGFLEVSSRTEAAFAARRRGLVG